MKTEVLALLPFETVQKKVKFTECKISLFHFLMKPKFIQDRTKLAHPSMIMTSE